MRIILHIERLILDGLPVATGQGRQLQQAVERELAGLLSTSETEPVWQSGDHVYRLAAPVIHVAQEKGASRLGEQIAAAVYAGVTHGGHGK